MCKTSHVYLKLSHLNYLCHSETLAFLPRLVPDISAFRTVNYVFWRATFKGTFSCGRARCNTCFFLLSGTSISGPKSNFTVCTVLTSLANLPMLFTASPAANGSLLLYISETGRQVIH